MALANTKQERPPTFCTSQAPLQINYRTMAVFTRKSSKYWYVYTLDRKKKLGRAVKLKTLVNKFGTEGVTYTKSNLKLTV